MTQQATPTAASEPDDAGLKQAQDIVAQVESGPRDPKNKFTRYLIAALCFAWACFQLYTAYNPINSHIGRIFHLAFAMALVFLAYPAFNEARPSAWVRGLRKILPFHTRRSVRDHIPIYDILIMILAVGAVLWLWWDFDNIILRQGLPEPVDVIGGTIMLVLLLEAARRSLGVALPIIAGLFLIYALFGPYFPDLIRHRGVPVDFIINDMYLSTTGVFGTPLEVSYTFVFLFVLFGALLDKAGAGKYFIDVAFAGLGHYKGGPAKAAVVASGMNGLVSGSSIANTVTTGTFTIPLMKQVGLPPHKAGAVEVASSTNGQLMPPVMGAAAFIMADIIGMPYIEVVRAALFPALISYIALIYVVHLEAKKLNVETLSKSQLPPLGRTFMRGLHYLLPLGVLIYFLVIERNSPIFSAVQALQSLVVLILVQKPIIAYLAYTRHKAAGTLAPDATLGKALGMGVRSAVEDIVDGLVAGARNMIAVAIAVAAAGIVVGVVSITGLVGRFVELINTLSFGSISITLVLTAICCIILGMGLPTTANYIMMATLTAPVIVGLGADAGLALPLIAAHLFVFYFGILADDTPPVGLAAYAAAAIARSDPIRTGVQGFTYDMRTAILPFIFLFNLDLLMIDGLDAAGDIIWIDDPLRLAWIFGVSLMAMFAFAAALQGFFADHCSAIERLVLVLVCAILFRPDAVADWTGLTAMIVQVTGLAVMAGLYALQRFRSRAARPA